MTSNVFCRYDLRTTDVTAARAFYSEVLGLDFPAGPAADESSRLAVWPLHEQALARGARPHWLGQLGVEDVEATLARLVALGAERLGPTSRTQDGTAFTNLRDPAGAVVGLRADPRKPPRTPVVWHQLHTRDVERAWAAYSELFGWRRTETLDVAGLEGGHRMFAWEDGGPSVGAMSNTARAEGVHAHWLYFFSVKDLDGAMAKVRAHGGRAPEAAIVLPKGDRLAPCEDGQGVAFGLYEAAARI